ncbi:CHAT domain-containing protein [Actinosynnema sp. NPDC047251]|uniref:CHAT domain-containing protein n=1 Tax=Saccharothrix espanaensis TaxID=103731 RepID=UPI0011DCE718|nr:CHAT domain-containing protein [Saccharothrix espanaensis]
MSDLFVRTRELRHLDAAIEILEDWSETVEQDAEAWLATSFFGALASAMFKRFQVTNAREDLSRATATARRALKFDEGELVMRISVRAVYANALAIDAQERNDLATIDKALTVTRQAQDLVDPDMRHAEGLWVSAEVVAVPLLVARYHLTDDRQVLADAVRRGRALLTRSAPVFDETDRASVVAAMAIALNVKAEVEGDIALADEAVAFAARAAALPGSRPGDVLDRRSVHGQALLVRFRLAGDPDDVDRAVHIARSACPADPTQATTTPELMRVNSLAIAVYTRYTEQHAITDLRHAMELFMFVSEHPAATGTDRYLALNNLGVTMRTRYETSADESHLDIAIDSLARAVDGGGTEDTGTDHRSFAHRRWVLGMWAGLLRRRFERSGDPDDLVAAEAAVREALRQTVVRRERDQLGTALGHVLACRAASASPKEARALRGEVVELMRAGAAVDRSESPGLYAAARLNVAIALREHFEVGAPGAALAESISIAREIAESPRSSPRLRLDAADTWARAAWLVDTHDGLVDACTAAIDALPDLVRPGLERYGQEELLWRYRNLGMEGAAAALAVGDPETALLLLERGRAILWTQTLRADSEFARLEREHPKLATRLTALDGALHRLESLEDLSVKGRATESRLALVEQRRRVLAEIHRVEGFADYLSMPGSLALDQLPEDCTVLVPFGCRYGCAALIVDRSGVRSVDLPITAARVGLAFAVLFGAAETILRVPSRAEVKEAHRAVVDLLAALYDEVAGPALDAAGIGEPALDEPLPRVWWSPAGLLSFLPLHAAGVHDDALPRAVLDRAVSSYTPTVRDLLGEPPRPVEGRTAVVCPPRIGDLDLLSGARDEAEGVLELVPDAVRLFDEDATADRVLAVLPTASWVHLACHGMQDPSNPAEAGFVLADRTLLLSELSRRVPLPGAVAVLAACDTARGGTLVADEAVTLVAAARFAGFTHVIGSLYTADDTATREVMRTLYLAARESPDGSVDIARTLHEAVRTARAESGARRPYFWAGLIHSGR